MKMQYTYKFATGFETIDVDKETYDILKELDRLDRNNTKKYRSHTIRIDAFSSEPKFMGVEDDIFKGELPASPAYNYAMEHLIPKYQDVLLRRLVYGEQFKKIAQVYNTTVDAIHHTYTDAKERFAHFYSDGLWIYSKENISRPEAERVRFVPFGLTPDLVQQILKLRYEHKTIDAIATLVGVPRNRVKVCLRHHPITEIKCLNCSKPVKQTAGGKLQNFCGKQCYEQWFHKEGMIHNTCPTRQRKTPYMSLQQQIATDFYRQIFVSQKDIAKILGLSDDYISAYCYVHTLPYTHCLQCGKQVPAVQGKQIEKYCSYTCCKRYWNHMKNVLKGQKRQLVIPPLEQLYLAIELREAGLSHKKIEMRTELSKKEVEMLFRFHPKKDKICPYCNTPFASASYQKYCSAECKDKAEAQRKAKEKEKRKSIRTQTF